MEGFASISVCVVTGATVALLRSSILYLAFIGNVTADNKAGTEVGSVQRSIADAAAEGVAEWAGFDRGRDLHWLAKWFGLLHFSQVLP